MVSVRSVMAARSRRRLNTEDCSESTTSASVRNPYPLLRALSVGPDQSTEYDESTPAIAATMSVAPVRNGWRSTRAMSETDSTEPGPYHRRAIRSHVGGTSSACSVHHKWPLGKWRLIGTVSASKPMTSPVTHPASAVRLAPDPADVPAAESSRWYRSRDLDTWLVAVFAIAVWCSRCRACSSRAPGGSTTRPTASHPPRDPLAPSW